VTFAHVTGVPIEEALLTLAPVLPLLALALRTRLARVMGQLRRGHFSGRRGVE
jgi:hypothetical protein